MQVETNFNHWVGNKLDSKEGLIHILFGNNGRKQEPFITALWIREQKGRDNIYGIWEIKKMETKLNIMKGSKVSV